MFNSNSIHSKLKLLEIQFSFYFLSLRFDVSQSHIGVKTKQSKHVIFGHRIGNLKNKSYFLMQTYLIGIKWAVLFSICYTGPVNKINTSTFFQSPFQP